MAIERDLISKKLDFLNQEIDAIEKMEFDEQSFVENEDTHDLVTFRLQQAIETCIDIATHLISALNLPRKETAKDAFVLLGEKSIIKKDLALKMGLAADFRNRVVHGYNNFDFRLLFKDYREDLDDLKSYGKQILFYLDSSV